MQAFTITNKTAERDHNGRPTGRTSYSVTGSNGATYEAYAPHGGLPWEVATLAKRADGGRAWRWAKDVTTGVASLIVAHIESSFLPSVQPVTAETFTETNALICFRACAAPRGMLTRTELAGDRARIVREIEKEARKPWADPAYVEALKKQIAFIDNN